MISCVSEDIPEFIIDRDNNDSEDPVNVTVQEEVQEENNVNQNVSLCGTCPDIPYNIATVMGTSVLSKQILC